MICVELNGGLGNQMFQYACGRSLAYSHQTELVLDLRRLKYNNKLFTSRAYELEIFKISAREINEEELRRLKSLTYRFFNTLHIKLFQKGIRTASYFVENTLSYDTKIELVSNNCYLSGYWQSPIYFQSIEKIIRDEFSFPSALNQSNRDLMDAIQSSNSVSLHIRRSDFVNNSNHSIHGVCSLEYYQKAIEIIANRVEHPVFFIFSDDIEWSRQNLPLSYNMTFVIGNSGQNSYIDMQLMSFCKNNIIANSSFSWWGAWLNNSPNKIVVAPKIWFLKKELNDQTKDLIPKSWIRI